MAKWLRFETASGTGFGTLDGNTIAVHEGELFGTSHDTGRRLALDAVTLLPPSEPTKMVCLWNNFHGLAAKFHFNAPADPLYFLKAPSCFHPTGKPIPRPSSYAGRVVFEGELGIVIGKPCRMVSDAEASDHVFGFTCINDVTAFDLLNEDPAFPQWTRAKNFDGFGVFGPVIVTGIDPDALIIRTLLNGEERQNYPVSDMFFRPYRLVSLISRDMTLMPGDVIACGTSLGSGSMKPGSRIEVSIEGIGTLSNVME